MHIHKIVYIYIYIYICVCVCVCARARALIKCLYEMHGATIKINIRSFTLIKISAKKTISVLDITAKAAEVGFRPRLKKFIALVPNQQGRRG